MADMGPRGPQGPAGTTFDLPVAVANGGTGATTAAGAVANLGIKVGGRNLLLGTRSNPSTTGREDMRWSGYGECLYVTDYHEGFCAVHATDVWSGVAFYLNYFTEPLSAGDEIVFSVDVTNEAGSDAPVSFYLMQMNSSGNRVSVSEVDNAYLGVVAAGETKRISFAWTVEQAALDLIAAGGTARLTLQLSTAEAYNAYFYAPKLERGNVATDWTPAPEDIEARLAALEATVAAL